MEATFNGEKTAYLYSRHSNASTVALSRALAAMENCQAGIVTSSGMSAIATTLLQYL